MPLGIIRSVKMGGNHPFNTILNRIKLYKFTLDEDKDTETGLSSNGTS